MIKNLNPSFNRISFFKANDKHRNADIRLSSYFVHRPILKDAVAISEVEKSMSVKIDHKPGPCDDGVILSSRRWYTGLGGFVQRIYNCLVQEK
jgi:hypothetical protein